MYNFPELLGSAGLLPLPSFDFSVNHSSGVVKSTMDTGRVRQRRRYTADRETCKVRFDFDNTEYAVFRGVWSHSLGGGADWFTMRLPIGDGNALTETQVRFLGEFSVKHLAHLNWQVSAEIEIQSPFAITSGVVDVLSSEGYDTADFEAAAASLETEMGAHFATHPW